MNHVLVRIRLLLIYLLCLLPFVIWGAVQALQASNNSPIDWVDDTFSARRSYDEFAELFGPGDAIVVSWSGCLRTDARLDQLLAMLRKDPEFLDAQGASYFYSVTCGREVLQQLTGTAPAVTPNGVAAAPGGALEDPIAGAGVGGVDSVVDADSGRPRLVLSEAAAVERLRGTLLGRDGQLTSVICVLNSAGLERRAGIVAELKRRIQDLFEIPESELHLAGPVIDGLTVDEASHRSLTQFALPSSLVIFAICLVSLRSFVAAIVVFLTASLCQALLLSVIYYSGERLSALLIILPPLVQVLTVSGGIHLMNYYLNSVRRMPPRAAAIECFRQGWLPTALSLGTTAIGTASLMVSGLEPIRLFGIYGTVGVLLTLAAVLTAIPCTMYVFGRGPRQSVVAAGVVTQSASGPAFAAAAAVSHPESALHMTERRTVWHLLTWLLRNFNSASLVLLFGVMALSSLGLQSLQTSVRIETLYEPNSRIMQDYAWLEDRMGPLVPIEVLLTVDADASITNRGVLDLLWKLDRRLRQLPQVKSTFSSLTLFPDLPKMPGLSQSMRLRVLNKAITEARPAFEQSGVLKVREEGDVWRMTAWVSALAPLDYGDVLQQTRAAADPLLAELRDDVQGKVTLSVSGIMPLVHQIQGRLLTDLFNSLLSALLVITVVMTVVQAGLLNGLLAMASNVFPIVIAFGVMGLLRHPMDIGSVMTASIALGIAVDDTLHFLTFFRRSLSVPGTTREQAVLATFLDCGPAMIQTSVSCGLGLLVFAFSDFVPTSRFAVLMAALLLLALLGDLLLLPALLLSRAGRLFEANESRPVLSRETLDLAKTAEKA
jgi:predicted RND superfamily exporter protein